jgi:hypothetical protein
VLKVDLARRQTESTSHREAARARSIRVTNLPTDAQEAILEQTFNQIEKVTKVILNVERQSATIEFEDEAVRVLVRHVRADIRLRVVPGGWTRSTVARGSRQARRYAVDLVEHGQRRVGSSSTRPRVDE